jgi:hypothetical protein
MYSKSDKRFAKVSKEGKINVEQRGNSYRLRWSHSG